MNNDLQTVAEYYDTEAQCRQLIEEMAELTQAIRKYLRANNSVESMEAETDMAEEIADVEIMLEQIKYLMQNHDGVETFKKYKIERQLDRMKGVGK